MMNIWICDDNVGVVNEISEKLKSWFLNRDSLTICKFTQANNLYDNLKTSKEKIDIIFLDIEIGTANGIALAEKINSVDKDIKIIFITAYETKYSQNIFLREINLCGFVVKPISQDIFYKTLEKTISKIKKEQNEVFVLKKNGNVYNIPFCKILLVESVGHTIIITTDDEKYSFTEKLDNIEEKFDNSFLRIHKSYIVNMNYIAKIETKFVYLKNFSQKIPISRQRITDVKTSYFKYKGMLF